MEQFPGYYARALRAIGQDLSDLLPESVTIEPEGDDFIARGMCNRTRLEALESSGWAGLRRLGAKLLNHHTPEADLDLVPFSRSYNAESIDEIYKRGNQCRVGDGGMPEIYSLGERLRTIGKVIDSHLGRLVKIYKDLHHVVFEYCDTDITPHKVELDNTELYRLQSGYTTERSDIETAAANPDGV
ncbi:MAG: hypothetical protein EXR70_01100 [Deltaproteobacteria bacterium]|nr:hypothetical protein [Deltaproteobacteria bacterium]